MEKIASFTIDHIKLQPGIYVSRKDTFGPEMMKHGRTRSFTLAPWAAALDVTC